MQQQRIERSSRRRGRREVLLTVALFVVSIQVLLPLAFYGLRNHMIFLPSTDMNAADGLQSFGSPANLKVTELIRADGRRLEAYEAVHRDDRERPALLFLHGNGGNLAWRTLLASRLARELDVDLLMLDYSGYGGSEGSPSPEDVVLDAVTAYEYLLARGIEWNRIVLFGESLGGGVAFELASRKPVAGIVTQSTFSSLSSMVGHVYPWMPLLSWLARDTFPSARHASALDVPVLVVHGDRDDLIPVDEAHRLHAALASGTVGDRAELLVLEGADHNNVFEAGGVSYLETLRQRCWMWTGLSSG